MRRQLVIAVVLVLLPLAVYWQATDHEFVSLDDLSYVYGNPHVTGGLSADNVAWAFNTTEQANWHPLVWLSLMLDAELYGADAGGFHLTNILLHIANGLLLFIALARMTGAPWKSGFVAALFAIHPLHVESVAWIASRKDVLSTLFGLLALIAYVAWLRRRRAVWYALSLAALACSLMSKQMLVTLPFLFLLLDYWPLGRVSTNRSWGRLALEKLPFVALVLVFCIVAFRVQQEGGAVRDLELYPFDVRLLNSILVYGLYVVKTAWPQGLAVYYPHPQSALSLVQVLISGAALVAVSFAVIRQASRRPYLPVGWAWYLGTLVPVIGLVQLGGQQMADRYTYVPIVGLFIAATWLACSLAPAGPWPERVLPALAVVVLVGLGLAARAQTGYWHDTETLYERALAVTRDNALIHNNLGTHLAQAGHPAEAIPHLQRAVAIDPDYADARNNLGSALQTQGRVDEAIQHFARAIALDPRSVSARMNWGFALVQQGRTVEAIERFQAAYEIAPHDPRIRDTLSSTLRRAGESAVGSDELELATDYFRQVARLLPDDWRSHYDVAAALFLLGRLDEARPSYERALELHHRVPELHYELGLLLLRQGEIEQAAERFREALKLKPDYPAASDGLRRATAE